MAVTASCADTSPSTATVTANTEITAAAAGLNVITFDFLTSNMIRQFVERGRVKVVDVFTK